MTWQLQSAIEANSSACSCPAAGARDEGPTTRWCLRRTLFQKRDFAAAMNQPSKSLEFELCFCSEISLWTCWACLFRNFPAQLSDARSSVLQADRHILLLPKRCRVYLSFRRLIRFFEEAPQWLLQSSPRQRRQEQQELPFSCLHLVPDLVQFTM